MKLCIVGGGILGLAAGRLIAREHPDASVVVLEKEREIATHQTARNSGVVHAGLYYEPGSLKARLCRRGVSLLRDYCASEGIPYEACGKVLVATSEPEVTRLATIHERALSNGVPGVRFIDEAQLREIEPHARGVAALHSPETAIVDYRAVATRLASEIVERGGEVRCGVRVARVRPAGAGASVAGAKGSRPAGAGSRPAGAGSRPAGGEAAGERSAAARSAGASGKRPAVELEDGQIIEADRVLVCAGLHSDRLAEDSGQPRAPRIVPFRGELWELRPERRDLVRGLIYPVPDPSLPFLGVHLTKRIDGSVLLGPNAVLALAREGYRKRDVSASDLRDVLTYPGSWRLFAKHWRTGVSEIGRSASASLFVRDAQRYVPELRREDVTPAPSGVRAQAVDPTGELVDDFRLSAAKGVLWVRNAPSPGATSSLAIAEELAERLDLAGRAG